MMSTAIYRHTDCARHDMGAWHPECPARLQAIDDQLIASRLMDHLEQRTAPLASEADLALIHTARAIAIVRDHVPAPGEYYPIDADTLLSSSSYQAALRAAGAAIAATDAVMAGEIENAFCAVRPPGHHACPDGAMGFCLFNNVAIAARHAMAVHGIERLAIIDFDVHHGNGTAEAFRGDARVCMASFFQHPLYPYCEPEPITPTSVNIPVPARSGGAVVRQVVNDLWLPALHAHRPQLIFISAGFDAHRDDELGGMGLVEDDYAWMTRAIMDVARQHAQGRIVSSLEGGYNLGALGRSVAAHIRALAQLD